MKGTEEQDPIDIANKEEIKKLVQSCSEGDEVALKKFFEDFSEDIYNFPIKVFHLDSDAASDFFLYAYERLRDGGRFRSFQGRSSFRTWFYTVLRNLVIDWMRTIREVNTVNFGKSDDSGGEFRMIENTPDPRTLPDNRDIGLLNQFQEELSGLNIELRVVFKLSYIYYLDLELDELDFICERSGRKPAEVMSYLADLKNELAEKELKNIGSEDKITSLYISILELKSKREKYQTNLESGAESTLPGDSQEVFELAKINRAIKKKYMQREKLLEKKEKGHFIVRTPYKYITEMIGIPEGSVSVQMMRAMDRIRGKK